MTVEVSWVVIAGIYFVAYLHGAKPWRRKVSRLTYAELRRILVEIRGLAQREEDALEASYLFTKDVRNRARAQVGLPPLKPTGMARVMTGVDEILSLIDSAAKARAVTNQVTGQTPDAKMGAQES